MLVNNSWNRNLPNLVAVSKDVKAKAEIAREITVNVVFTAICPIPNLLKNPEIAEAKTTAGVP